MKFCLKIIWLIFFVLRPFNLNACEIDVLKIKFDSIQKKIKIELADSYLTRKRGLMFRKNLDANAGMLFVYDSPGEVGFWMKNTEIPLDIAFANSHGEVVKIVHNAKPFSLNLIHGGKNIQYVLEVNSGMSQELNLFEGSELVHPSIGFDLAIPC